MLNYELTYVIPSRIAALLSPFLDHAPKHDEESPILSAAQLDQVSIYLDLLLRWNARINLTAVREAEYIVTRHFGESLFAARCLFAGPDAAFSTPFAGSLQASPSPDSSTQSDIGPGEPPAFRGDEDVSTAHGVAVHLIDVGSGPGFPGLPIKIYRPLIRLTLIESNHKKVAFLREVTRALTLTGVDVFSGRAETYLGDLPNDQDTAPAPGDASSHTPALADIVTLRAVERFPSILPTAANLLRPGGRLCLLIGQDQVHETATILPGFQWAQPLAIPLASSRVVLIGRKAG